MRRSLKVAQVEKTCKDLHYLFLSPVEQIQCMRVHKFTTGSFSIDSVVICALELFDGSILACLKHVKIHSYSVPCERIIFSNIYIFQYMLVSSDVVKALLVTKIT